MLGPLRSAENSVDVDRSMNSCSRYLPDVTPSSCRASVADACHMSKVCIGIKLTCNAHQRHGRAREWSFGVFLIALGVEVVGHGDLALRALRVARSQEAVSRLTIN